MANTDKMQVSIIGLGLLGASAGLALKRYADRVVVVGHDKNSGAANQAKSMGAVERTEWNLINAVRQADRVLLALPASEVHQTLEFIKDDLKPGCLILDTATVKSAVLAWARELLPPAVNFVGGHPVILAESQETSAANAGLFQDKIFCLVSGPSTSPDAFRMATDLAEALGARPFFIDAVEHDGLAAAVEHLPLVVAGALARATSAAPSWPEMRKLAAAQYYTSTYMLEPDSEAAAEACLANQTNTLRWIDNLVAELGEWRRWLEQGDKDSLKAAYEEGMLATAQWVHAQETGNWTEAQPMEMPTMGHQFRRMFGFGGRDFRNPPGGAKGKGK